MQFFNKKNKILNFCLFAWYLLGCFMAPGGVRIADQAQSYATGEIAVSPDGNNIIYFAAYSPSALPTSNLPYLCLFRKTGINSFQYHCLKTQTKNAHIKVKYGNSLSFRSSNEFNFINNYWGSGEVLRFRYNKCSCANNNIINYE